ncbi:8-oxo-dGTP diphosphatase [Clostridium saccharoperbutylacetonicum]|uniref:ADP-ribose pyrophosphatase n=1 Tax=Clostridium saccharoperbutylacetonicum N1-4(HMT) TaxID=931276 RepID=M1MSF1_9CLOT|nr:8-oxo-dGTP diphosphatase [Clostridium saccharoperbutylacetonicum]AGF54512.1 ADP-ribose pyrophosphatase [Clostridium saccharoperbutylacetonicum N1-4(HMT)]NRT58968.1 8-oxo-dGTP diphosphatase [Clostridium saccharoperbutylacetonicum]NSB28156.1 8-oxo-dGTP diphosphatase [Clostridium saccharoperbutylacetonicum]NSB41644.1 8-oxo-dGTP diphosphatase [Clostridium saccharoperbutylacetonicum]
MSRCEKAIVTVLCMVYDGNKILLQDRVKKDWRGLTFPGGHVEKEESFVQAVIREIYEETGLTISEPKLCGVKQFQTDEDERYIVLLFKTNKFEGTLVSSDEGEMIWVDRNSLNNCKLVDDFMDLIKVFDSDNYNEFMYERNKSGEDWLIRLY